MCAQVTRQLDGMLSKYKVGLCNIFLQHTSASLTINEVRQGWYRLMVRLMQGSI